VLFGLGASVYDWKDPFGRLFLQTLAMVAEFEANIGHLRTREGMAKARRQGGRTPRTHALKFLVAIRPSSRGCAHVPSRR
jgi:DNA invertase Pin-like site-specific DNA recombinase